MVFPFYSFLTNVLWLYASLKVLNVDLSHDTQWLLYLYPKKKHGISFIVMSRNNILWLLNLIFKVLGVSNGNVSVLKATVLIISKNMELRCVKYGDVTIL